MDLTFHIIAVHCNVAAFEMTGEGAIAELVEFHHDDHFGPCGLRHHPYGELSWTAEKLEAVLEEAEEEFSNYGQAWHHEQPIPDVVSDAVRRWEAEQNRWHERECGPDCKSAVHAPQGGPGSLFIPHDPVAQTELLKLNIGSH